MARHQHNVDTYQTFEYIGAMRFELTLNDDGTIKHADAAKTGDVKSLMAAHLEHYEKTFECRELQHDLYTHTGDSGLYLVISTKLK